MAWLRQMLGQLISGFKSRIDMLHKYHNAPVPYPTMHHFATEMYTRVHISATKWRIAGYLSNALWDLWDVSIHAAQPKKQNFYKCLASALHGDADAFNPLSPSDAYMRQQNKLSLVQIVACRMFGVKLSFVNQCWPCEIYFNEFPYGRMNLKMPSTKCRSFCLGLNV